MLLSLCQWGTWLLLTFPQGRLFHNGWRGVWMAPDTAWAVPETDLLPAFVTGTLPLLLFSQGWIRLDSLRWIHSATSDTLTYRTASPQTLQVDSLSWVLAGDTLKAFGQALVVRRCDFSDVSLRWPGPPSPGPVLRWWRRPSRGTFSTLHRLYKALLANQQGDLCNFRPTCSTFALKSLQQNLMLGLLQAADRLIRDHPGAIRKPYPPVLDEFLRSKRLDLPAGDIPVVGFPEPDTSLDGMGLLTLATFAEQVHPLAAPALYEQASRAVSGPLARDLLRYAAELRHAWERRIPAPKKPGWWKALTLIPGVGYALCGLREEAFQTLRLGVLLGTGLVWSLREDHRTAAWLYGGFLGWFLAGSIYGGWRCLSSSS